jgi:CheY-like chemotaxis protein
VIPEIADTHLLDPHLIPSIENFSLKLTTLALCQLKAAFVLILSESTVKSIGCPQTPDPKKVFTGSLSKYYNSSYFCRDRKIQHSPRISIHQENPKQIQEEVIMNEITILLVDDEEYFVKCLSEYIIKLRNLRADFALNGEEALKLVENEPPDVIVLDLKMPGIEGIEVLRRVKKAYPDVQVIILTAYGSEKDKNDCLRLGAFKFMAKPFKINELIQYIQCAYNNKFENSMA